MDVRNMTRWARVVWHLAGSPETTYEAQVRLDDDPQHDRTRIRAHIARRYLKVPEAAPLVRLDDVQEHRN